VRRLASLLVLALVLPATAAAATVRIDAHDNGGRVALHVGDVLVVVLANNPTTGYDWYVKRRDPAVLGFAGRRYVPAPNPKHLVGHGGTEYLRFRAVGAGSSGLVLQRVRPFDRSHPAGTFRVQVRVSGA
jgi:inhibitor of cysteine peptidase